VRNIIRQLAPLPAVHVEAPLNVESIVTIDRANKRYIVHFVQFNGVPDAQTISAPTTMIPMMEEAAHYSAAIRTSFVPRSVSAATSATFIARRANSIELVTNAVHESIAIGF
jgi:hypothetical protein